MPTIDRHPPGEFNWFELATTDQPAAKSFYGDLFGWQANDTPMGSGDVYTMFQLEGLDVAAAYTLRSDQSATGIPAHWDIYISVESADEAAAKIESFGGSLMAAPFDVMTHGRMAVASDPTGGVFCIWQAFSHQGTRIGGVDGTVCWADLNTQDPEAASQFYTGVFGWELYRASGDDSGYLHIKHGEKHIGGIPPVIPNVPPHWLLTFQASEVALLTNKAGALGATTLLPVTDMPKVGKFSVLQDPQGAPFALFQPATR